MDLAAPRDVPADVLHIMDTLWNSGHAAYLVGGGVRDLLLGRPVTDWDIATSALPDQTLSLFRGSTYKNRFGTVTVPAAGHTAEVTTFRRDHTYGDHRRPDSVTFTDSLDEDLARRDFTVNAIAWGRAAGSDGQASWVDPTDGRSDLESRTIRAVGNPVVRFDEDALRLLRAARFAAQLGFDIDPATKAAMAGAADTATFVSNERVGGELQRIIAADPPSTAFGILAETGVLHHALPELAAQIGVPQDKVTGHDLWGHCLATVDGAAVVDPTKDLLRVAALLHDIGKPPTFADGHFIGHDEVGASMAEKMLTRLAFPRRDVERVTVLIRNHMFSYERRWSGAAVRRFIRRVGRDVIDDLINLRRADNIGSGLPAGAGHLDELQSRVASELESGAPLTLRELAVDGDDLISGLGISPGPVVGEMLERLLGLVIADPRQNSRDHLLAEAKRWVAREGAVAQ